VRDALFEHDPQVALEPVRSPHIDLRRREIAGRELPRVAVVDIGGEEFAEWRPEEAEPHAEARDRPAERRRGEPDGADGPAVVIDPGH